MLLRAGAVLLAGSLLALAGPTAGAAALEAASIDAWPSAFWTTCHAAGQPEASRFTHPPGAPDCGGGVLDALRKAGRPEMDGPVHLPCRVRWRAGSSACAVLSRFPNIIMLGDSLTRQVFEALLMLVRDDLRTGGLMASTNSTMAAACTCDNLHSVKACRDASVSYEGIRDKSRDKWWGRVETACGGAVKLHMLHIYQLAEAFNGTSGMAHIAGELVAAEPRSLVYIGAAPLHVQLGNFWVGKWGPKLDAGSAIALHMLPVYSAIATQRGMASRDLVAPLDNVLYAPMHTLEYSKISPDFREDQGDKEIDAYNEQTSAFARRAGGKLFDARGMTANVTSLDGVHHSYTTNVQKALLLLEYFDSLP